MDEKSEVINSNLNFAKKNNFYLIWKKIKYFLIRDIRSFIPETKPKNELLSIEENFQPEPVIESLVDHGRLEALAFQREVLNWRDNAHAHLTEELIELHKKFSVKIDIELENIGLFKKLIWIQSDEVLQDIFIQSVKTPFSIALRKEEKNLNI